jgi:hypothetical protein
LRTDFERRDGVEWNLKMANLKNHGPEMRAVPFRPTVQNHRLSELQAKLPITRLSGRKCTPELVAVQ